MHRRGSDIFPADTRLAERIDKIVETLLNTFQVKKIVLFGSYARGDFDPEYSEIDLLIVANTEKKFLERIRIVRDTTEGVPFVNPLVYTENEYRDLIKEGEGFIEEALEEGKLIYEK